MRINNNIMAMNAHRQLAINQTNSSKSMERLSSGMRINRAGDDAAGLAISEKMRGQIRGLKQAQRNAQDGISLIQTAEGALNEIHSILQRMRELAVQASTDTNTNEDRLEIQKEINELIDEIDRIARDTQFNTMELLNGKLEGENDGLVFHIGANANQSITLNIASMLSGAIGSESEDAKISSLKDENLGGETGVQTQEAANAAITIIDDAIGNVSAERSKLGAYQNRLEHTINNLGTSAENLQAAESRIRDLDMAEEIMAFTKNNILQQAATAMLAQANMAPQSVLQLLG
jgi:flagellin